jgi:hypothetical protein
MKKAFGFILMSAVSTGALATPFTVERSETAYYYTGKAAEAAEAQLWKAALDSCGSLLPNSNHLPLRVSEVRVKRASPSLFTASAEFECESADGK